MKHKRLLISLGILPIICLTLLLTISLCGCDWMISAAREVRLQNEKYSVLFYNGGKIYNETVLEANSPAIDSINKVLIKQNNKWDSTIASYAPNLYLTSESITLNISPRGVVANIIKPDDKRGQFRCEISVKEY